MGFPHCREHIKEVVELCYAHTMTQLQYRQQAHDKSPGGGIKRPQHRDQLVEEVVNEATHHNNTLGLKPLRAGNSSK